ncbi:PAS domain-containing protein [Yoonia maritima]|uniref:PAS domain-containing protein n=1 Tax=Yoonia maritima TaxID=1435347 RepID=UPI000D10AC80|nr:PAS domain-containing protein [Yoonia maritima]
MEVVSHISFRRHQDFPGANDPILQSLEAYWQALRHASQIPSRNDIQPRKIDDALPHTFILQRIAPGIARMRVAGQKLHDLLKMDARGMPIGTFFAPEARDELTQLVETAFTEPAIIALPLYAPGNIVRAPLTGTMLMLPLRDDNGQTSRILGAIVTDGNRGNRSRKFEIAKDLPMRHETLGIKLARSHRNPLTLNKKGPDAMHPALRLVVNNA